MYILCTYVKCIYHYRGPHGRLAVTLCSYVFAKCFDPLKIKSLLTNFLIKNHHHSLEFLRFLPGHPDVPGAYKFFGIVCIKIFLFLNQNIC